MSFRVSRQHLDTKLKVNQDSGFHCAWAEMTTVEQNVNIHIVRSERFHEKWKS